MTTDEIMTLEQVARYLKLKPQTVYKWAQEGQIPAAKLGKEWRFRKRILDEWIDTRIMQSPAGEALDAMRKPAPEKPEDPGAKIEDLG